MNEKNVEAFKLACQACLSHYSIDTLRAYGRYLGMTKPTLFKKADLIHDIILMLCGELTQERNKRGAPVKNEMVDPKLLEEIEMLKQQYLYSELQPTTVYPTVENRFRAFVSKKQREYCFEFHDSGVPHPPEEKEEQDTVVFSPLYRGQLELCEGLICLLPEDGTPPSERLFVPVESIRKYDLREGDVITCYGQKHGDTVIASEILSINDLCIMGNESRRKHFDDCTVNYPHEILPFFKDTYTNSFTGKYLDWLMPVRKGQRGCIRALPKTGKTNLLYEIALDAYKQGQAKLLVLLLDQTPEVVGKFRKTLPPESLVYTTYEDDCDQQIYAAELILKRAKRHVESGHNVLFLIDSFNALARAYNETEESAGGKILAGGLESKTVHYLKKYFGTARCLEHRGSLTILGTLSENTGNPADDIIATEISALSNYEIRLSEELALKRIFPAIDYQASRVFSQNDEDSRLEKFLRKKNLVPENVEMMYKALNSSSTEEEFYKNLTAVNEWK